MSCKSQEQSLSTKTNDPQAIQIVNRAIEKSGGWENWKNIESISYKKRSILYHEDGSKESDITQFHEYKMDQDLSGNIFWKDEKGSHSIVYQEGAALEYLNGSMIDGSRESATKTFNSAIYVLFIPFKLMDPGVELRYMGQENIAEGQVADVIKASYDTQTHVNHSTDDIWYFYFDVETGEYLAYLVHHEPTYAYVINTKNDSSQAITTPIYRESYRSDADRNKQYLRGEFFYSDYVLF